MCVLIYRVPNACTPDSEILRDCWISNPDGAGFAWTVNGRVEYVKGLMSFRDFEEAFSAAAIPADAHLLIHFRWATHGGKVPGLTHPFPMADELHHLALTGSALSVMAHNGILSIDAWDNHSDTSSFVAGVMSERKVYYATGHDGIQYLLQHACEGNKVMELTGYGPIFYGDAWEEFSPGLFFSNMNFWDYGFDTVLPTKIETTKTWVETVVTKLPSKRTNRDDRRNAAYGEFMETSEHCYYCGEKLYKADLALEQCPFCSATILLQ